MANEGSTKPTYSELEAENLRVRGLLQRQSEVLAGIERGRGNCEQFWCAESAMKFRQGAESADIGKLDAADETGKVNMVDAGTEFSINSATPESVYKLIVGLKLCAYCKHSHTFQFDDIVDDDCPVVGCPCVHFLGSAETGGEKAAPEFFNCSFQCKCGQVYELVQDGNKVGMRPMGAK